MTTVKVEEEDDIVVTHLHNEDMGGQIVILDGGVFGDEVWLSPDEARELVKALKKHIKKAEGK